MPLLFDNECYYCRRGLNHLCTKMACVGLSYAWGGLAELAVLPDDILTVLPESVSELQGALVEPGAVAAYGVDTGHVKPGDSVLITGAGPIGALASLYAASLGARVFVSEVNPNRQALVRSLGIAEVLDPTQIDVAGYLKDLHEGVGVDAVIECSGNERALQTALSSVRSAGRVVQTGLHTRPASIDPKKGAPFAMRFPVITIRDMVRAQAMLLDHLGVERLSAVVGGSMGGMQVLEWAATYPDRVRSAVAIATAARHSAQNIAFHEVGRQAVMADPDWRGGRYFKDGIEPHRGLGVARMA
jgi:threonine dehydrogenase-like Zn-dependent dehydrogenase